MEMDEMNLYLDSDSCEDEREKTTGEGYCDIFLCLPLSRHNRVMLIFGW